MKPTVTYQQMLDAHNSLEEVKNILTYWLARCIGDIERQNERLRKEAMNFPITRVSKPKPYHPVGDADGIVL